MNIARGFAAALLISLMPVIAVAHHGGYEGLYDYEGTWTTWVTVTSFSYKNPHPFMTFDRTTKDGKVEHWDAELLQAPAPLARAGWTRAKSEEALKPGNRVKLYLATARLGGTSALVRWIENEKGEGIVTMASTRVPKAVDRDGVPGGSQPSK